MQFIISDNKKSENINKTIQNSFTYNRHEANSINCDSDLSGRVEISVKSHES